MGMTEFESADRGWLDERLRAAGLDPSQVVRIGSPRRPALQRENPWEAEVELADARKILGAASGSGAEAGRLIFVADVDEDPMARIQAGVELARAAVEQGFDVLLVDADLRQVGLSRWLPESDLDTEGLVDVLQYGASVAAARRPGPTNGIEILGIGSYRPDGVEVFNSEDVWRLVAQLKTAAALVIVIGGALVGAGRFHPMLDEADTVVLTTHRDPGAGGSLAAFLEYLAGLQLPIAGTYLWAGPDESERIVDDALLERSRVMPPAQSAFPRRSDSRRMEPNSEAGGAKAMPKDDRPDEPVAEATRVRVETERIDARSGGGTSPVVRGMMIAVGVVIIGFVGWWFLTWRSAGPERPRVGPPQEPPVVAAAGPASTGSDSAAVDVAVSAGELAAPTPEAGAPTTPPASGSEPESESEPQDTPVQPTRTQTVETSREVEGLLAEPVETDRELAERAAPPENAVPVDPFEAGLRRQADGGWSLHWFSFADSVEAVQQARALGREGYATAVRGADIKGKRWYRVLVGNFASREEATGFRAQAQQKFDVDWVGVVRH